MSVNFRTKHALCAATLMTLGLPAASTLAQVPPPLAQVDALEGLFGAQPTFRRSGAKGVCASGYFVGNAQGMALAPSSIFSGQRLPVVARFSVGGGSPKASDKGRSVRGLAFSISTPDGQQWQGSSVSAPVFFVSKPEQFAPFLQARTPDPATGKPNPERLKAFNDANPDTLRQAAYLAKAPVPASYASAQYWSTNAFELVSARGESQFARWQFVPEAGLTGLTDDELKTRPDDFLADELRLRVKAAAASFAFQFQLARPGDAIDDPTQAWPPERTVVTAGRLVIDSVEPGAGGACDKISFNPLALPAGIRPSSDPVLLARPAPYALSQGRRLGEAATR